MSIAGRDKSTADVEPSDGSAESNDVKPASINDCDVSIAGREWSMGGSVDSTDGAVVCGTGVASLLSAWEIDMLC